MAIHPTKLHVQAPKSPSNLDSDDDSPNPNSSQFGQLTPRQDMINVPQLKVLRYSPEVSPNSDNDSSSLPSLAEEDDFDERGEDSFSDAGDANETTTSSPEVSSSSPSSRSSSSSEDEGTIGTRYLQRARNKPPDQPPGTVHTDGGLKQHHQAALEVTENVLSSLQRPVRELRVETGG